MKTAFSLAAAAVLGLSLAACADERDEPIDEELGEASSEFRGEMEEAGDDIEAFGDDAEGEIEEFGDDVEDAGGDLADEVDPD